MRRFALYFAIAMASLLVSCKKQCGEPLTVENYWEAMHSRSWELTCESIWACPGRQKLTGLLVGTYPSLEACKAGRPLRFSQGLPHLLASIETGRVQFDRDAARSCLKSWNALTSHEVCRKDVHPAACEKVFLGQLSPGESCVLDADCAGELECAGARPGKGWLPKCHGTCRMPKERRCGDATCGHEEYCERDESSGELVCEPRVGEGESCTSKNGCSHASDTMCNRLSSERDEHGRWRGVCTSPLSLDEGDACGSVDFCKVGLYCIESTCQKPPPPQKEGQLCDGKRCDTGLVCLKPVDGGQATCVRPRTDGEPCRPTHECEPHLTCFVEADGIGTCKPRRPAGESCDVQWHCESFICEEGRCRTPQVCEVPDSG